MIHRGECFLVVLFVLASCSAPNLYAQIDFINAHKDKKVTAVYIEEESIVVDGELDEAEWDLAEPAKDFIQSEPYSGELASEQTEVHLLYDRNNLYVGAICFDSEGEKGLVIQDMSRDFSGFSGDIFQVVLDTFDDSRNGFAFGTNPKGSKRDTQTGGDGFSFNRDWDAVWHVKTARIPPASRVTGQVWVWNSIPPPWGWCWRSPNAASNPCAFTGARMALSPTGEMVGPGRIPGGLMGAVAAQELDGGK